MWLKRIFPKGVNVENGQEIFDECRVRVQHLSSEWRLTPRTMQKGIAEGWMSVERGKITLHTEDGMDDILFDIIEPPDPGANRNYYDCKVVI